MAHCWTIRRTCCPASSGSGIVTWNKSSDIILRDASAGRHVRFRPEADAPGLRNCSCNTLPQQVKAAAMTRSRHEEPSCEAIRALRLCSSRPILILELNASQAIASRSSVDNIDGHLRILMKGVPPLPFGLPYRSWFWRLRKWTTWITAHRPPSVLQGIIQRLIQRPELLSICMRNGASALQAPVVMPSRPRAS